MQPLPLTWFGIVRLGLVQTSLGAIVVLTTATMNRVMVVELALPAVLPGALVAWHYAIQITRPRVGYASDRVGRRTPWILGGMALLGLGALLAACATAWMAENLFGGIALAALGFAMIGGGVGAAGTTLLALLAKRVVPDRRAAAATIVWTMMIAGFVITATTAGHFLDPFSMTRLITVTAVVVAAALTVTALALAGIEGRASATEPHRSVLQTETTPFMEALRQVWAEPKARRFAVFVFVSMLAYSAQDLILEPFAGLVFGMTPGESTQLSGVQHGGVLLGMILVAIAGSAIGGPRLGSMRLWTIGGCFASALALLAIAVGGFYAGGWPLRACVFALGVANGAFAVAAIGSMMGLAGDGRAKREGVRMGVWGAAQAIAFGLGGFLGTVAIDVARALFETTAMAYAIVFTCEAVLFLVAAQLAAQVGRDNRVVHDARLAVAGGE